MRLENRNKFPSRRLKSANKSGSRALQSPQKGGVNLSARGQGFEVLNLIGAVKLAFENGAGEVVVLELLLLLEVPVGLDGGRDLLGVDEEPHVHALHAGLQRLPGRAFHGLVNERVLRHDQFRCFWERLSKLLELLHREALVVDAGEEVTVLELLPHSLHRCLFLCAGNCGADGGEARRGAVGWAAGGNGEWIGGPGQELGLGLGFC